jgi:hypothetical protein
MDQEGNETKGPGINSNQLFIRTSNNGDQAFFEYSLDNQAYQRFGPTFTLKFGKWTGDRLGFFCWNEKEEKGFVDVDWFKYEYDGPKGKEK